MFLQKLKNLFYIAILATGQLSISAPASSETVDLFDAIENNHVEINSLSGNGSSSGSSITGFLTNKTGWQLNVSTRFSRPILLKSSSMKFQNMLALEIYNDDGSYSSDGKSSFIQMKPHTTSRVIIIAFCADFDKDTPGSGTSFSVTDPSDTLIRLGKIINGYDFADPYVNPVVVSQLVLWLDQGVKPSEIKKRFSYSEKEERVALSILRSNKL